MSKNNKKINDQLALSIGLKYSQLKRDELPNIEVSQIIDYLYKYIWRKTQPKTFSEAVSDVMAIDADNMVIYLSNLAVVEAKDYSLNDFSDLFEDKQ